MILNLLSIFAQAEAACKKSFLGLPQWYKYLEVKKSSECAPVISELNDFWLIGLALIELLIRLAILIAIGYIIWAGIRYSESRGNVDKATKAKYTLIDAITGLIIAVISVAIVSFIGGRFS